MAYPYQFYPQQYQTQPNTFQNVGNVTQGNVAPMQQQMQNGGYVIVQSEEEIRRYPVAHGNIITFRIENQPIVVEKSMGYSQFDTPHYEKYKLIKEDMEDQVIESKEYILKSDYEAAQKDILDNQTEIFSQIKELKKQLNDFRKEDKRPVHKKEVES